MLGHAGCLSLTVLGIPDGNRSLTGYPPGPARQQSRRFRKRYCMVTAIAVQIPAGVRRSGAVPGGPAVRAPGLDREPDATRLVLAFPAAFIYYLAMKRLITFAILCATFSSGAFGQSASVNTIVGMGYLYPPVAVAPGQLITLFVAGDIQGAISAAVQGNPAPVLEVRPRSDCQSSTLCSSLTAITVQIPYEIEPGCFFTDPACNVVLPAQLVVTVNGIATAPIALTPVADRVHILTACDTVVPGGNGSAPYNGLPCSPLVTHADGSLVTSGSPARGSEEVVAYAVGLGLTTPAVPTGQPAATATPTYQTFFLDFNFRSNALATQPMQPTAIPVLLPTSLYFSAVFRPRTGVRRPLPDQLRRAATARGHRGLLGHGAIEPDGERGRADLV